MGPETQALVGGAVQTLMGLAVSTGFLLTLFIGFLVVAGFTKLRKTGRGSLVVRNLVDQMDGSRVRYITPDDLSGSTDQLRTPELLEQAADSVGADPARGEPSS